MKTLKTLQKLAQRSSSSIEYAEHTVSSETFYLVSWWDGKKTHRVICDDLTQVEARLLQINEVLKLDRYNPEPIVYQNRSGAGDCCDNCKHKREKRLGLFCDKLQRFVNYLGTCPDWEHIKKNINR